MGERASKSTHLQRVSGASCGAYWAASALWDGGWMVALMGGVHGVFWLYGDTSAEVFIGTPAAAWATLALTTLYGLACLPLDYLFALGFSDRATAQVGAPLPAAA